MEKAIKAVNYLENEFNLELTYQQKIDLERIFTGDSKLIENIENELNPEYMNDVFTWIQFKQALEKNKALY